MNTQELLKPFNMKELTIPTRIVMAPMTRNFAKDNIPGSDVAAYYRRRAENKVGLIITEGTVVEPRTGHGYPNVPDFKGDEALKGWKNVVDNVHEAGGKIFPQLWHAGSVRRKGTPPDPSVPGYGPSAVIHPFYTDNKETPEEMTSEEINSVVSAFGEAAKQAEAIGFDGIEIHGAHGYLIDQFFWEATNKRSDSYGGSTLADRMQFAVEVVNTIREKVSKNFPVCFRFSQWKMGDFKTKLASNPQELEQFLDTLVEAGVDIFHCSTRRFHEPEFSGSDLNLAGWTRKLTGKPVITVGSIGLDLDFVSDIMCAKTSNLSPKSIDQLIDRLEKNEFDLVAVGRALLADYEWVTKIVEGRFDEINVFTKAALMELK
ncbi:MAG: NADH:flavin oxidoreductase [Deltaproteobacteria bacterium]|nr:NADH:flavin oxidoreductase [Deltaproteobacteria bacterium]